MSMESSLDKKLIGVVGLGLMGSSIATALVSSEYSVIGLAPIPSDLQQAPGHIQNQLCHCKELDLLQAPIDLYFKKVDITDDYQELERCHIVIECITEEESIKSNVYKKIEQNVPSNTIIGTNTSAIPISHLQKHLKHPGRFLGLHWAEPAYATRFLEITCGDQTEMVYANEVFQIAPNWNKEPTLLRKDIRGFITNRLMYAVYREGLALHEKGVASLEDLDKAFRYGVGSWITIMGIFRRMDYIGINNYTHALKSLLPLLSNSQRVSKPMKEMVEIKARGIHNLKGLYSYTDEDARRWEEAFSQFNKDMHHLIDAYSCEINTEAETNSDNEDEKP